MVPSRACDSLSNGVNQNEKSRCLNVLLCGGCYHCLNQANIIINTSCFFQNKLPSNKLSKSSCAIVLLLSLARRAGKDLPFRADETPCGVLTLTSDL